MEMAAVCAIHRVTAAGGIILSDGIRTSAKLADKSLLLIPDITGFTEFVQHTELEHSQHIISELLELVIDANEIGLTVAEIEGDAVLFFKQGSLPTWEQLVKQAESMFVKFHAHLRRYETERICQCGACSTAEKLSLKIVVHSGEIGFLKIKEFVKPHGEEMIIVHRLLKNSVPLNEYVLLSESYYRDLGEPASFAGDDWLNVEMGASDYEKEGTLNYRYFSLQPLRSKVPEPTAIPLAERIDNPVVVEGYVERAPDDVFEIASNFAHRLKFTPGLDDLEFEAGRVNRAGSKHQCLIGSRRVSFKTVKGDFDTEKLVYGEHTDNPLIVSSLWNFTVLEPKGTGTQVRIEFHYHTEGFVQKLLIPVVRVALKFAVTKLFKDLKVLCESGYLAAQEPAEGS
jgi:hypothetical protein